MKNDYLWNKEGSDPEIEALETKLSQLRAPGSKAPRIHEAVQPQPAHWFRVFFRPVIAFSGTAAAAALVLLFLAPVVPTGVPEIEFSDETETVSAVEIPVSPSPFAGEVVRNSPAAGKRNKGRGRLRPAKYERTIIPAATDAGDPGTVRPETGNDTLAGLTDEEKFAYRQIMLAISITGSKLKMVRDKVPGYPEDPREVKPVNNSLRSN